jgi:hypothetical protein
MKPFNLEEALAGAKVVTRDGRAVERLRFTETENLLWGQINQGLRVGMYWYPNGGASRHGGATDLDLFMYEEPVKIWEPTMMLRQKEMLSHLVLQQKWVSGAEEEWRDVPTV